MRSLGVRTADFSVYYDLVQALRARGIPFVTLDPAADVPLHIGVVITTPTEAASLQHPAVVPFRSLEQTIDAALHALTGASHIRVCVIGIDPGERPGVAVLADGRVLRLHHAATPERVRAFVDSIMENVDAERFLVRVGHGAPTYRDRILQTLAGIDARLELVNETSSSPVGMHGNAERDCAAAANIALIPGFPLSASDVNPVVPTPGEMRDIQRKSRLLSEGQLTISRALARNVLLGHLTLDDAINAQRQKA